MVGGATRSNSASAPRVTVPWRWMEAITESWLGVSGPRPHGAGDGPVGWCSSAGGQPSRGPGHRSALEYFTRLISCANYFRRDLCLPVGSGGALCQTAPVRPAGRNVVGAALVLLAMTIAAAGCGGPLDPSRPSRANAHGPGGPTRGRAHRRRGHGPAPGLGTAVRDPDLRRRLRRSLRAARGRHLLRLRHQHHRRQPPGDRGPQQPGRPLLRRRLPHPAGLVRARLRVGPGVLALGRRLRPLLLHPRPRHRDAVHLPGHRGHHPSDRSSTTPTGPMVCQARPRRQHRPQRRDRRRRHHLAAVQERRQLLRAPHLASGPSGSRPTASPGGRADGLLTAERAGRAA